MTCIYTMKDSILRMFSRILWMILQEGGVVGTLGGGGWDHSRGVGGAGGRGIREGGSSAPHWGRGRAVTSSHGMGSLDEAGRED